MYFVVVTRGLPSRNFKRVHRDLLPAQRVAQRVVNTGTCTAVQIIACPDRTSARQADISRLLPGQEIVHEHSRW